MKNKFRFFILRLWGKSQKGFSLLSFLEKIVFSLFVFGEGFYCIGFLFFEKIKKRIGVKRVPFWVVSIGNLSVGGTGKSVVVSFLAKKISAQNNGAAILLRGYGRKSKENILIHRKRVSVDLVGDEALMLARQTGAIVVVGRDRFASAMLLLEYCKENDVAVSVVILDDAYQNHRIKKDCEVLLLDARHSLENGHCLPAGPLREKDLSRANIVLFTHADEVEKNSLQNAVAFIKRKAPQKKVFLGRHVVVGIRKSDSLKYVEIGKEKMLAVAGIGSFLGFVKSAERSGVVIGGIKEFPDHHLYDEEDVDAIIQKAFFCKCDGIITTSKDWQKLEALVGMYREKFFILEIDFSFMGDDPLVEEETFCRLVCRGKG